MINTTPYVLGKTLEWLHRLIILYSLGEDELPKEYKVLLNRYRLNDIHEADRCILLDDNHVDVIESYEIKISESNDIVFPGKPLFVSVRFIIVNEPISKVVSRNKIITIIIGEKILNATDTNCIRAICELVGGQLCLFISDIPFFNCGGTDIEELCCNIISYYFIKSVFNNNAWSMIVDDLHSPNIIAKDFVFKRTSNIKSFEDLISKIVNEDDEVWGYIAEALSKP